jgi:hypothetical protein
MKQIWWNVYLNHKWINKIPYDESYKTAEEIKRSLVTHDGFDSNIVVRKERKKKCLTK